MPPDPSPPRQEADPDQRDVIAFLSNPETYPAAHGPVKRLDTHGAMVFLSGERTIKIKKPVAFSYMDFSTLEKRRRAITREYEINAPHAPTLYLKVLPITREPSGQLALGGKGEVVEWALIMRRFRQSRLLSAMADDGGLERDLMTRLARVIARLHQSAPAHLTARPLKALKTRIEHNEQACRNYPEFFEETRIDALFSRFHEILEQRAGDFNKRGEEGFVRRCHGDLHLRNMVLLAGEPVLFDAIEFDEEIATIDILDDLAFVLMDLVERGLPALANHVLNVWLGEMNQTAHYKALALLPFYLSSRAGIRSKVMLSLMEQHEGARARTARQDAISYFETSETLIAPVSPRLVAVGGLSGSGKTTLARKIAPHFGAAPGAVHLRSDVIRKHLFKVSETTRLPKSAYSRAVTQKVYAIILERARAALAAGYSVIVDAVYAREPERRDVEAAAQELGIAFHGLWLEAPAGTLMDRVSARRGDASDADRSVVAQQLEYETGRIDWERLNASQNSNRLARQILERVIGIEPTTFSLGS